MTEYVRRSARVLLVGPDGAVLLFRSRFRRSIPGQEWAWFVPGGGVEPGESVEAAAVREIAEETGIDISEQALTHLAYAEGTGTVADLVGPMRDDVFVAETTTTEVSTDRMERHESAAFGRYRWWSVAELTGSSELIFPRDLSVAVEHFVAATDWREPMRLPW